MKEIGPVETSVTFHQTVYTQRHITGVRAADVALKTILQKTRTLPDVAQLSLGADALNLMQHLSEFRSTSLAPRGGGGVAGSYEENLAVQCPLTGVGAFLGKRNSTRNNYSLIKALPSPTLTS
jgi:hypothetical protein